MGGAIKAMGMVIVGIALGLVGTDVQAGQQRFTFSNPEVLPNLDSQKLHQRIVAKQGWLWLIRGGWHYASPAGVRGNLLGAVFGILPGGGVPRFSLGSSRPDCFGNGVIEGPAGPESVSNAGAQSSFIPLPTLGLPSHSVMALGRRWTPRVEAFAAGAAADAALRCLKPAALALGGPAAR